MNMPVLPVVNSNITNDANVRGKDTATDDNARFSNVLSSKSSRHGSQAEPNAKAIVRDTDTKSGKRFSPDDTLSLIMDTIALPLVQDNKSETTKTSRFSTGVNTVNHKAQPVLVDIDVDTDTDTLDPKDLAKSTKSEKSASPDIKTAQPGDIKTSDNKQQHLAETTTKNNTKHDLKQIDILQAPKEQITAKTVQAEIITDKISSTSKAVNLGGSDAAKIDIQITSNITGTVAQQNTSQAPTQTITVPTPLSSPNWAQDFGRQFVSISQNTANLGNIVQMQVNPPELGPVRITLHVSDGITQASFVSPHAIVRQTLENALPQLQQQLAQAGLSLGDANVSDQQASQQQFADGSSANQNSGEQQFSLDPDANISTSSNNQNIDISPRRTPRPDAIVDTFA